VSGRGAAVSEGRVFRRIDRHGHRGPTLLDRALAEIVAARTAAAGLAGGFAGHSLRAGFATAVGSSIHRWGPLYMERTAN